jgi:hypoxanthine phosphoribosyltransferase
MGEPILIRDKQFSAYLGEEKIRVAVKEMAARMNVELKDEFPLFLVVLNGAFIFAADLLREVTIPCEVSFVKISSYRGMVSTGQFRELVGLSEDVKDRTVVVVEDIIDSGRTLDHLTSILKYQGARAVLSASALFKREAYTRTEPVNYIGFEIANDFVVGYGMDYEGQGRNLKDIHILSS